VVDNPEATPITTPSASRRPSAQEEVLTPETMPAVASSDRAHATFSRARQRAVSLGSTPPSRGSNGSGSSASGSGSGRSSNTSSSGHTASNRSGGSTYAPPPPPVTPALAAGFNFPFSLSTNPLAFFQHAHTAGLLSRTPSRTQQTAAPGSADRASGVHRPQRNRSASVSYTEMHTTAATAPSGGGEGAGHSPGEYEEVELAQQKVFLKEAMCHLMSMLAFVPPSSAPSFSGGTMSTPGGSVAGKKAAADRPSSSLSFSTPYSASSLFGSVVPHMYEQSHTSQRRRFNDWTVMPHWLWH
jgi:hypothetical protein